MITPLAPIVLFAYNRPEHTRKALKALSQNELAKESDIFIYCDGPKADADSDSIQAINQVREIVHSINGFRTVNIIERTTNIGLDLSEIQAITDIITLYGKVIAIEDDLITSKFFLRFMNEALDFYESDNRIYQIAGYTDAICFPKNYQHSVFASYRAESCGWGTWANRWRKNNWDWKQYKIVNHPTKRRIQKFNRGGDDMYPMLLELIQGHTDAWDIRWAHTMFVSDALVVRPCKSLLYNIGFDGTGIHCGQIPLESVLLNTAPLFNSPTYDIKLVQGISVDKAVQKSIKEYFFVPHDSIYISILRKLKRAIKKIFFTKDNR